MALARKLSPFDFKTIVLVALFSPLCASPANAVSPAEAAAQVGSALRALGDHLPEALLPEKADLPRIRFVRLEADDPWSLGIIRSMRIKAPIGRVQSILDDIPGYVGLYKDLLVSRRISAKGPDDFVLYTETEIPVPLVSNDRTSVHYRLKKTHSFTLIDSSLVESNHLKSLEGASLLVSNGVEGVSVLKVSFIRVGFGAARALPAKVFWVKNAQGGLQTDWALKLRSEQKALTAAAALKQSEDFSDGYDSAVAEAYGKAGSLENFLKELKNHAPQ